MEGIIKTIVGNTASATMEMFRGASCLYPLRWLRGEGICAAVYPNHGFLFTLNYAFTHYVALLLIAWSIPPVCRKLRELLGFPEDRGAWLRLFWLVLLFLVTAYGTAVSKGMKTVLAFTVVGRLGLFTACLKVAYESALAKRARHETTTFGFTGAQPWLLVAMGSIDGTTALLTCWYLVKPCGTAAVVVAVGGLVDMLAGGLLAMIPALAAELDGTASVPLRERLKDPNKGTFWVTIFAALLLALGSYSVLVGAMGLLEFIPMTIPVLILAAIFCLWSYISLRIANKTLNPWLLLLFGGVLFVLALCTAAVLNRHPERSNAAATECSCSIASSVASVTQRS